MMSKIFTFKKKKAVCKQCNKYMTIYKDDMCSICYFHNKIKIEKNNKPKATLKDE